jgi:hypothetical protein
MKRPKRSNDKYWNKDGFNTLLWERDLDIFIVGLEKENKSLKKIMASVGHSITHNEK